MRLRLNRRRRAAFTLMEVLVVVAIIVALASIGGYFLLGQLGQSQKDIARSQVKGPLSDACKTFFLRHNEWPQSLEALTQPDGKGGPYLEDVSALVDPWGRAYKYDPSGSRNGGMKPDIWAIAPDGATIGNWAGSQ